MRTLLISIVVAGSLGRLDRPAAKEWLRRLGVRLCRALLAATSRELPLPLGTTVVFAPHPDDETLGCGALIAQLRRHGDRVHVIFITDGAASHPGHPAVTRAEMAERRRREALAALSLLSVDPGAVHFLDHPDGTLANLDPAQRAALLAAITRPLAAIRPLVVFAPCHRDGSSEHDAACELVHAAIATLDRPPQLWEYPVWAWRNPALLFRDILRAAERRRVKTGDTRAVKQRAIACYRTQTEPLPPQAAAVLPVDFVRALDGGTEYFLCFRRSSTVASR